MSDLCVEAAVKRLSAYINNPLDPFFAWSDSGADAKTCLATMARYEDIRALIASWRARGEALEDFIKWSEAYPTTIFVEPDLKRAHELLQAGDMTLDAVSASVLRSATKQTGERARAALGDKP